MVLKIKDRISLSQLFPQSGGILVEMMVREIADKVKLTKEEIEDVALKQEGINITWNVEKDVGVDFSFSDSEMVFLKDRVAAFDKEEKITQELLDVCLLIKSYVKAV